MSENLKKFYHKRRKYWESMEKYLPILSSQILPHKRPELVSPIIALEFGLGAVRSDQILPIKEYKGVDSLVCFSALVYGFKPTCLLWDYEANYLKRIIDEENIKIITTDTFPNMCVLYHERDSIGKFNAKVLARTWGSDLPISQGSSNEICYSPSKNQFFQKMAKWEKCPPIRDSILFSQEKILPQDLLNIAYLYGKMLGYLPERIKHYCISRKIIVSENYNDYQEHWEKIIKSEKFRSLYL